MLMDDERQLESIKKHIFKIGGLDCQCYKITYLKRRLAVRMRATNTLNYREYLNVLLEDPQEYELLLDRLTINVSHFFRDPVAYRAISRLVLPVLEKRGRARIWSAGCANGEEPYSLGMMFHARMPRQTRIFATDIDMACLGRAKQGVYKTSSVTEVPFTLKQAYLERREDQWSVKPVIKDLVTFQRLDLTGTLLPGPFELIVCRNVMIYFNRLLQERLLREFHRLLLPDGFLVLGKTEVLLAECRGLFKTWDVSERIYQSLKQPPAGEVEPVL